MDACGDVEERRFQRRGGAKEIVRALAPAVAFTHTGTVFLHH
jgi:hypothetical protein